MGMFSPHVICGCVSVVILSIFSITLWSMLAVALVESLSSW